MGSLPLWPARASTLAPTVDALMLYVFAVAVFFAVVVGGLILFFAIKYHHRAPADRSHPVHDNLLIELVWTGIPLGLALSMFVLGAVVFVRGRQAPANAMQLYVVGKQWMWKIQHPEGAIEINELHIPVGRPVKLLMISEDVIHDFFVPAFRIKQDVLPGRYTTEWFQATEPGSYRFFCAQYCGLDHSRMVGQVIAMAPADYERWLNAAAGTGTTPAGPTAAPAAPGGAPAGASAPGPNLAMVAAGEKLFNAIACGTCHKAEGGGRGPSLAGLYNKTVELEGGKTVIADEGYIRESILLPQAKIVKGYKPIMPTFQGQLEEDEVLQLIAYIESLRGKK